MPGPGTASWEHNRDVRQAQRVARSRGFTCMYRNRRCVRITCSGCVVTRASGSNLHVGRGADVWLGDVPGCQTRKVVGYKVQVKYWNLLCGQLCRAHHCTGAWERCLSLGCVRAKHRLCHHTLCWRLNEVSMRICKTVQALCNAPRWTDTQ